jgi:4a-hydroxytetrahydrobiopterin dehydratase
VSVTSSPRALRRVPVATRGGIGVVGPTRSSGSGQTTILRPIVLARHTAPVAAPAGWSEVDGALERTFEFGDFSEALAFVNRVGQLAESENHHPDIAIHYNRVTLRWWTHTAGGITDRDLELATRSGEL